MVMSEGFEKSCHTVPDVLFPILTYKLGYTCLKQMREKTIVQLSLSGKTISFL